MIPITLRIVKSLHNLSGLRGSSAAREELFTWRKGESPGYEAQ